MSGYGQPHKEFEVDVVFLVAFPLGVPPAELRSARLQPGVGLCAIVLGLQPPGCRCHPSRGRAGLRRSCFDTELCS